MNDAKIRINLYNCKILAKRIGIIWKVSIFAMWKEVDFSAYLRWFLQFLQLTVYFCEAQISMPTITIIYNIYIIYNSKYILQVAITVYDLLNKKLSTEETEDKMTYSRLI